MTGFTINPETLSAAAQQMRSIAQQLGSAWQPVAQQTQSVKFGRGDDVVSPLIQVSLEGAMALVDSCLKSSGDALGDYADGLDSMAALYADTEQNTTTMMGKS